MDVVASALTDAEARELDLITEPTLADTSGLLFMSCPIEDRSEPSSVVDYCDWVDQLADHVRSGRAVAIHCRQGIGRASMLAVGVLRELGWPSDQAWSAIEHARGRPVPDTPSQRVWVDKVFDGS